MTLEDYLAEQNLDRHQFAERINVSAETTRRYLAGKRVPNKHIMARILLVTEGRVTPNDFFRIAA